MKLGPGPMPKHAWVQTIFSRVGVQLQTIVGPASDQGELEKVLPLVSSRPPLDLLVKGLVVKI